MLIFAPVFEYFKGNITMKRNTKLFIGLVCLSLGLTACTDDFFDQEAYDNLIKQAFPVADIDPNHTWRMYGTTTVDVYANINNDETYRVRVYKENPHTTSNLTLLGQGTVKAGSSTQVTATYTLPTSTAYVVLYDKNDRRVIHSVNVSDGATVTADFFGSHSGSRTTRSESSPEVADITLPYDEAWVATYNETAKEPNSDNVADNYDNSVYHEGTPGTTTYKWNWSVMNEAGYDAWGPVFTQFSWGDYTNASEEIYNYLKENGKEDWVNVETTPGTEGYWEYDENFVLNFKITDTYSGTIGVAATEGLTDGVENGNQRTIVVTGTWNITENQKIGSLGKIIIANGGTVNVASGVALEMVNQARLVVLRGGTLTGEGSVSVNNGNAVGEENYNAGTISVGTFNNNFGKFYNYGSFLVNEYQGGAQESNFYNHSLVTIDHFGGSTANARIFNGCQFYVKNNARIRNYEGVQGSALIVGGQLMFSGSEDGTTTPTYVGLAAGALVQAGSLYNNGTSWTGPTEGGYAVLSIGQFDYLNWTQDAPETGGYFINNLYVQATTWENAPDGNGTAGETADIKFANVRNAGGNGNVQIVYPGDPEIIPADEGFVLGEAGCTPGFSGEVMEAPDPNENITRARYRWCFEDNFPSPGDYDFNDCVITVEDPYIDIDNHVVIFKLSLDAVGATKQIAAALRIVGLTESDIVSISCTESMDTRTDEYCIIPAELAGTNTYLVNEVNPDYNDVVLRLFNDAHSVFGGENAYGMVDRIFYNTVAKSNTTYSSQATTEPFEVEYTIRLVDNMSETRINRIFGSSAFFDVFIVESHSSTKWEVHTIDYKFDQVLKPYAFNDKYDVYSQSASAIYPWALCLPGEFKYPNEWYSISGTRYMNTDSDTYGYTDAAYPDFYKWAQDHESTENWWLEENADPDLIYK